MILDLVTDERKELTMEYGLENADVSREWEAEERDRIEAELSAAADIDHINRINEDELSGIWFAGDFAQ